MWMESWSSSSFLGWLDLCVLCSAVLVLDGDGGAVVRLAVHGRLVQVRVRHAIILVLVAVLKKDTVAL